MMDIDRAVEFYTMSSRNINLDIRLGRRHADIDHEVMESINSNMRGYTGTLYSGVYSDDFIYPAYISGTKSLKIAESFARKYARQRGSTDAYILCMELVDIPALEVFDSYHPEEKEVIIKAGTIFHEFSRTENKCLDTGFNIIIKRGNLSV